MTSFVGDLLLELGALQGEMPPAPLCKIKSIILFGGFFCYPVVLSMKGPQVYLGSFNLF
ncbi:MAG: hypothetical protein K2Y08_06935 [Alphaproteobacteria bacterium]|nr:hypothetical protein [Alphaproteobacteria bacterium]